MNFNKLTAALAVSAVMMMTAGTVTAEEITFAPSTGMNVIASCPLEDCPRVVTPENATCPKCKKESGNCGCKKEKSKCYEEVKEDISRCKAEEEPPINKCEENDDEMNSPLSAACPLETHDGKQFMQQTYAYPAAIYGNSQVIGERNNGVYLTDGTQVTPSQGIPVARENDDNMTGAAASPCIPCLNQGGKTEGVPPERIQENCKSIEIQTQTSLEAMKKSLVPYEVSTFTGGAAPLVSSFDDIPAGFWAGCDINKLTENNIIAGYPDRTFKPDLPVSRAEMATLTVKGFNLNSKDTCPTKSFKDVPRSHWANKMINKAVSNGLMAGYCDDRFKPDKPVSRAEAFTILSKGIKCEMSECKADEILSQYCDANTVPGWAKIPVAKAIDAGALKDSPKPDMINPNKDASRAEIASMLENIRVSIGYSSTDKISSNDCGCTGAAAFIEHEEIVDIPTLQLTFGDEVNAKSANIGDKFAATTIDSVVIDGTNYPAGSIVRGKVMEVVRPTKNCQGSLRLSFETIEHCDCKANLPKQVLTAQVTKMKTPNPVARIAAMPFTWTGGLIGTIGRTVGGAIVSAGNAVENVTNGVGVGTGEIFQGQFKAAGRSYADATKALVKAPIDATRTAVSGTMGLFQYTGDELTYLVDPKGMKVSSINPQERVTVAFGCN